MKQQLTGSKAHDSHLGFLPAAVTIQELSSANSALLQPPADSQAAEVPVHWAARPALPVSAIAY